MSAPREGQEFWTKHVLSWRSSGLDRREYCQQHGLSARTFSWWIWKLGPGQRSEATASDAVAFVPVDVAVDAERGDLAEPEPASALLPLPTTARATGRLEVELPSGCLVRVGRDFDPETLRRIALALGAGLET